MTRTIPTSRRRLRTTSSTTLSRHHRLLLLVLLLAPLLAGCGSSRKALAPGADIRQLARAGLMLGFDIGPDDDWPLLTESASWLGVPYRYGGNDSAGVDCSGLSRAIYQRVYGQTLHRNSLQQYELDCRSVGQRHLQSGDLVFFAPKGKKRHINHVGIYLKEGRFLHASSSRGVMVSSLGEPYFQRTFAAGGRPAR